VFRIDSSHEIRAEATPANHRQWIDHLVKHGAVVVYPRYEQIYSPAVLAPAIAGIQRASGRLDLKDLPVLALGYSRGAALAVEYAAVAPRKHVPVPDAVESVNPVPYGETSYAVDLSPLRPRTVMAVIVSEKDPHGADGAGLPGQRGQAPTAPRAEPEGCSPGGKRLAAAEARGRQQRVEETVEQRDAKGLRSVYLIGHRGIGPGEEGVTLYSQEPCGGASARRRARSESIRRSAAKEGF